jgi:phospholipid transport system substrate-binding protein
MTRFVRTLIASLALAAAVSASGTAFAGEAQDLVQARRTQVAEMLKGTAGAERDKKVAAVLSGLFDFDAMAKESLGSAWGELNDDQRAEFTGVLKQLVQRTLEKNIRATATYDVQFLGEEPSDDSILVKTKAQNTKNEREEPILIDYRMKKGDAGWRGTDVITEGTSMVGNYRSQFKRIYGKEGFSGLMKKMKDKLKRDGGAALVRGFSPISARAAPLRTERKRRVPPEPTSTKLPGLTVAWSWPGGGAGRYDPLDGSKPPERDAGASSSRFGARPAAERG